MTSFVAPVALIVAVLLAIAAVLAAAGNVRAALQKPTYTAGDRWVYVLQGSLDRFPGLNATNASMELGLSGLAEVDVLGDAETVVQGAPVPGVRVATHATGFLNGTFALGGNGTVHASGTFTSETVEVWEGHAYLPTVSNSSTTYVVTVPFVIPISVTAGVWVNATTSYASLPPFNLSVGESATTRFTTDVNVTATASFFGLTNRTANATSLVGVWGRQVLDAENVTVEAGTFAAYRLNESIGSFPGLGIAVAAGGANETGWFSNDAGNFVRRQAFLNGTPVAEMRLKSYTYPAAPQGLPLLDLILVIAIPVAVLALVVFVLLRRRRKKSGTSVTTGTAGPVGELPPKPPGAGP